MKGKPAPAGGATNPAACTIDPGAEWSECRSTIARFDGTLWEARKYGFVLVSTLLTANALITPGNLAVDRTGAGIVIMALVFVLFLLDCYYADLLGAAVGRAEQLESGLEPGTPHTAGAAERRGLSSELSRVAAGNHVTRLVSAAYALFIVIAAGIPLAVTVAGPAQSIPATVLVLVFATVELVMVVVITGYYHRAAGRHSPRAG